MSKKKHKHSGYDINSNRIAATCARIATVEEIGLVGVLVVALHVGPRQPRDFPAPTACIAPLFDPFRDAISAARPTNNPAPQTRRRWLSGERTPTLNPPSDALCSADTSGANHDIDGLMGVFDAPDSVTP